MKDLSALEARIIKVGVFLVFVVTYGDYVLKKISPVIRSWFR